MSIKFVPNKTSTIIILFSLVLLIVGITIAVRSAQIQRSNAAPNCPFSITARVVRADNLPLDGTEQANGNDGINLGIINNKSGHLGRQVEEMNEKGEYSFSTNNYTFYPYKNHDNAYIYLTDLNTDNWQVTGAFCKQRGNSTVGCDRNPILVSPRPLVASHATVDRNSWTDPEIGPIHITCDVDIEYGWIIEPIESTQKQIPQNQTKNTIPYSYILKDLAGYAAMDTPTTGGLSSNTKVLTVKDYTDKGTDSLRELVKSDEPKIVIFEKDGEIKLRSQVFVGSNTSILGLKKKITIKNRGLLIKNESNVIVAGLEFTDGKGDAIEIRNSHHVWIDHITAQKYSDGLIDIVSASHNVTVSRSKLTNHEKVMLIGNSSTDTQVSKVTLWGNYFSNFGQRSPRVRYGTVDMYNNVIENWTNSGIRSTLGAIVNVQNNIFIPGDAEKLLPRFAENFKDEPYDEPGNIIMQGNFSPNPTLQNVVNTSKFINAAVKYTRPYPAYPPSMQKSSRLPFSANTKLMKQITTSAGRQPTGDTKID